ncbi:hypothetical protein IHE45_19G125100 [Dioscorea alata]|uniref:Uncharacterized protein n=1 Tax=Dioscorea alata TaxID=55571 RepID=A0ACB7U1K4_DIOAL|nr:hypothetical protein IHE45_19G125100 [Dioscorea alata]
MIKYQAINFLTLITLLLLLSSFFMKGAVCTGYFPTILVEYGPMSNVSISADNSRRMLGPFQLCLACRCCSASDPTNCSSMPCCFGIDCNLPDKPYGVCAFVPKTCNCTSCV